MAWLAVTGVVRCGDNGHYEVFYLYIWDERLCIPFYLFMTEKNGSDIVIFINGCIETECQFCESLFLEWQAFKQVLASMQKSSELRIFTNQKTRTRKVLLKSIIILGVYILNALLEKTSNTAYMSETRNLGTLIERWWRSRGRCLIKINVRRSKFIGVKQPELKYCDIFMAGKNVEYDFVNSLIASVALCIKLWDGRACSKEVTLFKEGGILAEFDL